MTPRHHRKGLGLWLAAGLLFLMQAGVRGEGARLSPGPSQGALPLSGFTLAAASGPTDTASASPQGGGGGGAPRSKVVPVLRGNPEGLDAVPETSPSPSPQGGGGGGGGGSMDGPFIRVLPGGDAADWTRSPSPSPR